MAVRRPEVGVEGCFACLAFPGRQGALRGGLSARIIRRRREVWRLGITCFNLRF